MRTITIDWSSSGGPVPGYGDIRATPGEYVGLFPDRYVESAFGGFTFQNPIGAGGENLLDLRMPRKAGDGRYAGLGHTSNRNYEWLWPAGWVAKGPTYGPDAVIYGAENEYVEIGSREEYGRTGGWRFVNEKRQLVDCISTHDDKARGLYQFTYWPDVAIGQGAKPDMGMVVEFAKPGGSYEPLRRFDPRPEGERTYPFVAFFPHSVRDGDQFGVMCVDMGARKTYFCWPTLVDLRALPFVTASPNPIPPVEPPMPTDYLGVNQRVRAKYPTPLGARHWEFIVDLCQQTGTLAFEKNGGAHVLIPSLGKFVSLDVIGRGSLGDNWADTLRDAEGAAIPIWDQHPNAAGTYIDVSSVQLPGGSTPPPTDRVAVLEAALREVDERNDQIQALSDQIAGIIGRVL